MKACIVDKCYLRDNNISKRAFKEANAFSDIAGLDTSLALRNICVRCPAPTV